MKIETIQLTRNNFHIRPLTLINSVSTFFTNECQIYILFKNNKYNVKSLMNLINFWTDFTIPPYEFDLKIDCANDELANLCMIVLKSLFLNIHVVYFKEAPVKRSKDEEWGVYKELLTILEKEMDACHDINSELKAQLTNHLREILGLKKYRIKAILHSAKGMHVAPSTQLRLVGSLLNCKITLDCTNRNHEPQSCDISDTMGLLSLSIPDGTAIYVNSEGKNCEEAAAIIKYILEHLDTTIMEWQMNHNMDDKKEWGRNLLAFIRKEML